MMILFVDDEKYKMDSYRRELEISFSDAYEVRFEWRVDDALRLIHEHAEELKLLILDVMMNPGNEFKDREDGGLWTGVHLYEKVRARLPQLPVIVFSNVTNDTVKERLGHDSRCWFLNKEDYLPYELADEIREILSLVG